MEAFPQRAAMYVTLACECGALLDLRGVAGPRTLDGDRHPHARSSWRLEVRRSAREAAYQATLAASSSACALIGQAPVEKTWRCSFVLQAAVRDAPSGLLLRAFSDAWVLIP